MKFVISLLLTSSVALALPMHVFHEERGDFAGAIRQTLIRDYGIPEDLILMKSVKVCEEMKPEGKINLCLKNNGDLIVVSVDREFINESLKVFRAP